MNELKILLFFIGEMLPAIVDIIDYVRDGKKDEEQEKQLAMTLIRKAKDAQAKKEIEG